MSALIVAGPALILLALMLAAVRGRATGHRYDPEPFPDLLDVPDFVARKGDR